MKKIRIEANQGIIAKVSMPVRAINVFGRVGGCPACMGGIVVSMAEVDQSGFRIEMLAGEAPWIGIRSV